MSSIISLSLYLSKSDCLSIESPITSIPLFTSLLPLTLLSLTSFTPLSNPSLYPSIPHFIHPFILLSLYPSIHSSLPLLPMLPFLSGLHILLSLHYNNQLQFVHTIHMNYELCHITLHLLPTK